MQKPGKPGVQASAAASPQASMSLHHWATETHVLLFLASLSPHPLSLFK